jgi:hypothetical protein
MAQRKIRLLIRQRPSLSFHRQRRSVTPKKMLVRVSIEKKWRVRNAVARKEMASKECHGQSDDEEGEEEDDGEEEEMEEEVEAPERVKENQSAMESMDVINIARKFTSMV